MKSFLVGWLLSLSAALSLKPMLLSGADRQTLLSGSHELAPSVYRAMQGGQTSSPPAPPTNLRILYNGRNTIFFDDFTGSSIDPAKWTVLDRLSDQANAEVNCVVPQNVSVNGGLLTGVSKFEDHVCGDSLQSPRTEHYTSWQIQQATAPFLYGTVEFRAKLPGGIGIWPDLWMLGYRWQASQPLTADDPAANGADPGWGEIDIAEFWQNSRTTVNNSAHVGSPDGLHLANLTFNASTQFAVYRLEWTSSSLIWSVDPEDGLGFRTLRTLDSSSGRVPSVPYYIVMNAAIGGNGGGTPDPSTFPQTVQLDYVRVTQ
jgi:beta-glucanase (GH16 family)